MCGDHIDSLFFVYSFVPEQITCCAVFDIMIEGLIYVPGGLHGNCHSNTEPNFDHIGQYLYYIVTFINKQMIHSCYVWVIIIDHDVQWITSEL